MVQLVGDDHILRAEQGLEEPTVGVEARGVQDRVFGAEETAEPTLQLLVQLSCAADEPNRRHPEAPALQRLLGGVDHRRMVGESEIVVSAKIEYVATAD